MSVHPRFSMLFVPIVVIRRSVDFQHIIWTSALLQAPPASMNDPDAQGALILILRLAGTVLTVIVNTNQEIAASNMTAIHLCGAVLNIRLEHVMLVKSRLAPI